MFWYDMLYRNEKKTVKYVMEWSGVSYTYVWVYLNSYFDRSIKYDFYFNIIYCVKKKIKIKK